MQGIILFYVERTDKIILMHTNKLKIMI